MLFMSGMKQDLLPVDFRSFNLAIEMLFMSGQGDCGADGFTHSCFNLAIEMLFMSGQQGRLTFDADILFQSRNRDAFHVRKPGFYLAGEINHDILFQSRNRDAFHVRSRRQSDVPRVSTSVFQSRNRDAFHVRQPASTPRPPRGI